MPKCYLVEDYSHTVYVHRKDPACGGSAIEATEEEIERWEAAAAAFDDAVSEMLERLDEPKKAQRQAEREAGKRFIEEGLRRLTDTPAEVVKCPAADCPGHDADDLEYLRKLSEER